MQIRQLMQKQLITCLPSDSIHDAASKMKNHKIGAILILDEVKGLKGILTDRDIALGVVGDSLDVKTARVSDVMTPNPVSISADSDVETALSTMSRENVRRLPVTQDGQIVGMISTADLAADLKEEFDQFISLEKAFAKQ